MRTVRRLIVGLMMTGFSSAGGATFAAAQDLPYSDRVRTSNADIAALIQHASERSTSFRSLIDAIKASDGIVLIEEGKCGRGMRACFVTVTRAGPNRMLWVKLDLQGIDCDLMGLIGHELQHTVEVLGDPSVTDRTSMYFFYSNKRDGRSGGPAFETDAAIKTGEAVRAEVRRKSACKSVP
jgi:hypothetical protein